MVGFKANSQSVVNKIERVIKGLDFTPVLKEMGEINVQDAERNMDTQGAIYQAGGFIREGGAFSNSGIAHTKAKPWKPLAESTRKDRKRKGYPPARPILYRRGDIRNSFEYRVIDKTKVKILNRSQIAIYHQEGNSKLPQRILLGVSDKAIMAMKVILTNFLKNLIK